MKSLLLVAMVAVVSISTSGCAHNWFNKGAACNTCPTGVPEYSAAPVVTTPQYVQPEGTYLPSPQG